MNRANPNTARLKARADLAAHIDGILKLSQEDQLRTVRACRSITRRRLAALLATIIELEDEALKDVAGGIS